MDSMRSLNRSLPTSQSTRSGPPEQLLQAFKQAALSVTNLYKSAASDQETSRQAGYQDALDDLLKFLDKENIGVQDGEGWQIREWITARYDGGVSYQQSESEDEPSTSEPRQRSSSPTLETKREQTQQRSKEEDVNRKDQSSYDNPDSYETPTLFHFRAGDSNTETPMQTDEARCMSEPASASNQPPVPLRAEVRSRNKNMHKITHRLGPKSSHRSIQFNSPTKRKLPFPDISEIFNVNLDRRDGTEGAGGGPGSKRSRFL